MAWDPKGAPLPIEQGAEWSLEQVWMLCERRKFLAGTRTLQTILAPHIKLLKLCIWLWDTNNIKFILGYTKYHSRPNTDFLLP